MLQNTRLGSSPAVLAANILLQPPQRTLICILHPVRVAHVRLKRVGTRFSFTASSIGSIHAGWQPPARTSPAMACSRGRALAPSGSGSCSHPLPRQLTVSTDVGGGGGGGGGGGTTTITRRSGDLTAGRPVRKTCTAEVLTILCSVLSVFVWLVAGLYAIVNSDGISESCFLDEPSGFRPPLWQIQ